MCQDECSSKIIHSKVLAVTAAESWWRAISSHIISITLSRVSRCVKLHLLKHEAKRPLVIFPSEAKCIQKNDQLLTVGFRKKKANLQPGAWNKTKTPWQPGYHQWSLWDWCSAAVSHPSSASSDQSLYYSCCYSYIIVIISYYVIAKSKWSDSSSWNVKMFLYLSSVNWISSGCRKTRYFIRHFWETVTFSSVARRLTLHKI